MTPPARRATDATIARLEVHGGGGDPVAARLRLEALLGALELRPRSLPATTILCVRELRDPLPGALSLASRRLRPPAAWEQAMQRELDRLADVAAWPSRAAVPAAAAAVAFADEAELLACLASDLLAGGASSRWWWRLLVPGIEEPRRAVAAAWRDAVEHAPAALDGLAERGEAAAFARALDAADVRALALAVAERFALPVLAATVASADFRSLPGRPPPGAGAWGREEPPPWRAVVDEAEDAALPPDRRALVGVVLALARAPSLVRSAGFAARVLAWRDAVAAPPPAPDPAPPRGDAASQAASPRRAAGGEAPRERGERHAAEQGADRTAEAVGREGADLRSGAPEPPARSQPRAHREPPEGGRGDDDAPTPGPSAREPIETRGPDPPSRPRPAREEPRRSRARTRALGPAIETGLGGLFYLLNLALYLRLYGDDAENLPLSPWDLVELVGRRLLADAPADGDGDDPVWPLLAALSGRRDGEPPGAGFEPPLDWAIPAAWLRDLPAEASLADARPLPRGLEPLPPAAPPLPADPLERWLARVVPYVRARLRLALALDATEDLAAVLLRHRARVHVSDARLDVVLSLDALPVAIRLAGLDRDPGWIAAAGRAVAFHFE